MGPMKTLHSTHHAFPPWLEHSLRTSDKRILSILFTLSSYRSPFCLNVPYISGLGKQFCTAGKCTEAFHNVKRAGWKQGLGFFMTLPLQASRTWWEEVSWPVAAPAPAELHAWLWAQEQARGRVAHGLWILQHVINKRNPQNPQTN